MGPRSGAVALTSVGAAAIGIAALVSVACTPTRAKSHDVRRDSAACPAPSSAEVVKGVATEGTWLAIEGFGARIQMPAGWQYAQQGSMIVAASSGAEYMVAGACTQSQAKKLLARSANEFGLTIGGDIPEREVTVNGLHATRIDIEGAQVLGKPARSVALVADAPSGKGYIVVLGYAREGHASSSRELSFALDSLAAR